MSDNIFSFRFLVFLFIIWGLFFGCADSDSYRNTSSEAPSGTSAEVSETAGGSATSGADSELTTPPQVEEEISESTYTLPTWPLEAKKEKGKAYPWDEGPSDPDFAAFRKHFYQVVKEKKVDELLAMTFDTIHFSYGDDASKENFIRAYGLDTNPEVSNLWTELVQVLELGGAFYTYPGSKNRQFFAPFVYNLDQLQDPFTSGVIIGENVRLRDGPNLDSKIIGSLSWDIYEMDLNKNWVPDTINGVANGWKFLETVGGEQGYVFGQFAREPVDYRVGFAEYEPGKWRMDFFIAGD